MVFARKRDFLSVADFNRNEISSLLVSARRLKKNRSARPLVGKTVGLIFQKPSTRTAVSFAVGVAQLGGNPLLLSSDILQIKRGESPKDTGRVLSRYLDAIAMRADRHSDIVELAQYATIPVINALTDKEHPCQVLADLLTIMEAKRIKDPKDLSRFTLAYVGDGNNVAQSLVLACAIMGMPLRLASPPGFEPAKDILDRARQINQQSRGQIALFVDPHEAVKGADGVYTDVWASMGQESEIQKRREVFAPYQVNRNLLKDAKTNVIVLHCLPAHRGEEITDDVLEGRESVVFDQAENRLHVQKAVLMFLLKRHS